MKLHYTVTREDYLQGLPVYYSVLAPGRVLTSIGEPFACVVLGFGIYAYAMANRPLAISLFLTVVYLLSKGYLFRFIRIQLAGSKKSEPEHFQLETSESGVVFSTLGSPSGGTAPFQRAWSEFRGYCETWDLFALSLGRTFYVVPKHSLTAAEISEFNAVLTSKIRRLNVRTGRQALRHALSLAILAFIAFFFFGGMLEQGIWWVLRPLQARQVMGQSPSVRHFPPASLNQLVGHGRIYLVPIGGTGRVFSPSLFQYYKNKYGLSLHVLPSMAIPEWVRDDPRKQLVAEELIEAMRRAYPKEASAPDGILIGVTDEDMYIADLDWKFALNFRHLPHVAVISTARLNPGFLGEPAAPQLFESRLRKLMTKNIGISYYHLELSRDRGSVLYDDVENMNTLDTMSEDYSVRDAARHDDDTGGSGDLCLTVRHYYSERKARRDWADWNGCSSTHGESDLEVLNVDLRYGLLLTRRTDFYFPGQLPLELSRVLRTQDRESRAFGIGGNHSLNIFPVGNTWPFTWMDLILEDGGRFHYRRINWGASYWDAIYRVEPTITDFYSSHIKWDGTGWVLARQDGWIYRFPSSDGVQHGEQAALIAVQDRLGNRLQLRRERSGELVGADAGGGKWMRFQYDSRHRVTLAADSQGRSLEYRYDSDGCLEEVKDVEQHVTRYGHDGARCPTSMAIDGHQVWSAQFDSADRVIKLELADLGRYQFRYVLDSSGAVSQVEVVDPADGALTVTYDESGYSVEHFSGKSARTGVR